MALPAGGRRVSTAHGRCARLRIDGDGRRAAQRRGWELPTCRCCGEEHAIQPGQELAGRHSARGERPQPLRSLPPLPERTGPSTLGCTVVTGIHSDVSASVRRRFRRVTGRWATRLTRGGGDGEEDLGDVAGRERAASFVEPRRSRIRAAQHREPVLGLGALADDQHIARSPVHDLRAH
jgi:hypothetical protein